MSVIPRCEFLRFLEMLWKAVSPETDEAEIMYPNLVVSENGFLKDICFSHRDSLYCSLSSSPLPQCICIHLLSCCWAARPREHRPASFDTSRFQRTSSLFFSRSSLKISLFFNTQAHTYDFCPFTSCCRTEKPN